MIAPRTIPEFVEGLRQLPANVIWLSEGLGLRLMIGCCAGGCTVVGARQRPLGSRRPRIGGPWTTLIFDGSYGADNSFAAHADTSEHSRALTLAVKAAKAASPAPVNCESAPPDLANRSTLCTMLLFLGAFSINSWMSELRKLTHLSLLIGSAVATHTASTSNGSGSGTTLAIPHTGVTYTSRLSPGLSVPPAGETTHADGAGNVMRKASGPLDVLVSFHTADC